MAKARSNRPPAKDTGRVKGPGRRRVTGPAKGGGVPIVPGGSKRGVGSRGAGAGKPARGGGDGAGSARPSPGGGFDAGAGKPARGGAVWPDVPPAAPTTPEAIHQAPPWAGPQKPATGYPEAPRGGGRGGNGGGAGTAKPGGGPGAKPAPGRTGPRPPKDVIKNPDDWGYVAPKPSRNSLPPPSVGSKAMGNRSRYEQDADRRRADPASSARMALNVASRKAVASREEQRAACRRGGDGVEMETKMVGVKPPPGMVGIAGSPGGKNSIPMLNKPAGPGGLSGNSPGMILRGNKPPGGGAGAPKSPPPGGVSGNSPGMILRGGQPGSGKGGGGGGGSDGAGLYKPAGGAPGAGQPKGKKKPPLGTIGNGGKSVTRGNGTKPQKTTWSKAKKPKGGGASGQGYMPSSWWKTRGAATSPVSNPGPSR